MFPLQLQLDWQGSFPILINLCFCETCHGISCLPCSGLQLPRAHLQGAAGKIEWLMPNFHLTCAILYSLVSVGISRIYITVSRRDIKTKEWLLIRNCTWETFLNALNMKLILTFTCLQGITIILFLAGPLPQCPLGMMWYHCFFLVFYIIF